MRRFVLRSHSMRQPGGSYGLMSSITTDYRRHRDYSCASISLLKLALRGWLAMRAVALNRELYTLKDSHRNSFLARLNFG